MKIDFMIKMVAIMQVPHSNYEPVRLSLDMQISLLLDDMIMNNGVWMATRQIRQMERVLISEIK